MQPRLSVGQQVASRYQVAQFLGSGEMGEVYDVRDSTTGYAYALKLLGADLLRLNDAWAALQHEAQKASGLGAESIAKSYEFAIEPSLGLPYVLGEFVAQPNLSSLVRLEGPLGIPALEAIFRAIAPALEQAHAAGLIHRALKPNNIFASPAGGKVWNARIGDFGIGAARLIVPPAPGWTGTPGWISAEQADPATPAAPSMDVYSLGLVAFYALTAQSPFLACRSEQPDLNLLWAEMTAPLPAASHRARELGITMSPTLDPWFARALAVSPAQRFRSVAEMATQLWSLIGSSQHVATMRPPLGAPAAVIAAHGHPPVHAAPHVDLINAHPTPQSHEAFAPAATQAPETAGAIPSQPGHQSSAMTMPPTKKKGSGLIVPIAIGGALAGVVVLSLGAWLLFGRASAQVLPAPSTTESAPVAVATPPVATSAEPAPAVDVAPVPTAAAPPEPDAAAPEQPTDALVTFACEPQCDQIVCDNKPVQDVSAGVRLKAGKHMCVAIKRGYVPKKDTFTVTAGEDTSRSFELVVAPRVTTPPPAKTCGTFLNPCKK